jgi:hypothetical protein
MNPKSKRLIKICTRVTLFSTPIACLVYGIIGEREAFVIGGAMGILLAFIISILTEFHERQLQRRQSIKILVSGGGNEKSMRNITIEIMPSNTDTLIAVDEIPDDTALGNIKSDNNNDKNTGAAKDDIRSAIETVSENI